MLYKLLIQPEVFSEMESILLDIYTVSESKSLAEEYVAKIESAILQLKIFPKRHPFHQIDYIAELGYRSFQIKNYTIFYRVDDLKRIVYVARVLMSSRDFKEFI